MFLHKSIDMLLLELMNTRLTIDLQDEGLTQLLRLEAAQKGLAIREVVVAALESYFSARRENGAVARLAERAFAEWDNPKDAEYDTL